MNAKHNFCSACGNRYPEPLIWPRACSCGDIAYINPKPVVVGLVEVGYGGLLVGKRNHQPKLGQWALIGGFMEINETWQEGLAREIWEETGIIVNPGDFRAFGQPRTLVQIQEILIFGTGPRISERELEVFVPNSEMSALRVINGPEELGFPLHSEMARIWFETQHNGQRICKD